jgi:transposase
MQDMPMDLPAILLPDAAHLRLDSLTAAPDGQALTLVLASTQTTAPCPLCGTVTTRIHSRYTRTVLDLPWAGMLVQLRLHVHKFFCSARDCIRTIFTERLPHVLAPRARRTRRLATAQQRIGLALGDAAGERLADELAYPAGTDTLLDAVRQAPIPTAPPATKVGIDDWAKCKGQSYATIVVDLETRQPIDLLPERSAECVAQWLQEHPGVEIISRDRGGVYAEGARQGAPDAVQVADRWHLLKNLGEAVLQVLQTHQAAIEVALAPAQPSAAGPAAPGAATEQGQSAPQPSAPGKESPPLSRAGQERQQRQENRQARYDAIQQLHQRGWSLRAIAQHLNLERKTVRKYLHAFDCPHPQRRPSRPSLLDPYKPYLLERWNAGCRNAMRLLQEIEAQGFRGKRSIVRAFLTQLRKAQGLPPRSRNPSSSRVSPATTERPPTLRNLTWSIIRRPDRRAAREQEQLDRLREVAPDLDTIVRLAEDFAVILREQRGEELDGWLERASTSGIRGMRTFAASLRQDYAAVKAAATLPWSNGPTEGNINRLKLLKRQMYGRAKLDLLRQRVLAG